MTVASHIPLYNMNDPASMVETLIIGVKEGVREFDVLWDTRTELWKIYLIVDNIAAEYNLGVEYKINRFWVRFKLSPNCMKFIIGD